VIFRIWKNNFLKIGSRSQHPESKVKLSRGVKTKLFVFGARCAPARSTPMTDSVTEEDYRRNVITP